MKITVATVCFNAETTLPRTIESVLKQSHQDVEHLIIDGASKDRTATIARDYAAQHPTITVISEPDKGMYDALNKALDRFTGEAFGVLNADDRYADTAALERIAGGLASADVVYGHLDFVDAADTVTRRWRAGGRPRSGFRGGWMPAHPTFYVRRAVAERVGPFDLAYPTASDYHWMMRALPDRAAAQPVTVRDKLLPHVLITMQEGGRSTASLSAYVRHNLEAMRARRDVLGTGPVDAALVLKPARKAGQFLARLAP